MYMTETCAVLCRNQTQFKLGLMVSVSLKVFLTIPSVHIIRYCYAPHICLNSEKSRGVELISLGLVSFGSSLEA